MNRAKRIPSMAELVAGIDLGDDLDRLLEQEPPVEWLKVHPTALTEDMKPVLYIPIERIDWLLRSIFSEHRLEVLTVGVYQYSIQVSVRLYARHPMTGEWIMQDGVGGSDRGKGVEVAIAIAETNAKKSAAKKLGKIFGRDLSRDFDGVGISSGVKAATAEGVEEISIAEIGTGKEPVNPVKIRIIKQMYATRTSEGLKKAAAAFYDRAKEGQVDADDPEILKALNDKAEKLGINL